MSKPSNKMPKLPSRKHFKNRYLEALAEHYSVPLETIFKHFRLGAIGFGVGLALIIYANASMQPSLQQELLTLGGLIVGGIGFTIAMMAHIRMLIGRFVLFYLGQDNKTPPRD